MNKRSILFRTLARALSLARPHGSATTAMFTHWLIDKLPERLQGKVWCDAVGNVHIDNRTEPTHKTLFVAHVDTVHHKEGGNQIRKTQHMWYANGAPLGADDGAGVALLMHMIHSDVAGYYVYTQGEEVGGIGAKYLASTYPDLLAEFDRAIAFDRRGVDSIISHQGWGRCASDAFAQSLADAFNDCDDAFMYSPDDTGVYTDTREFTHIIPECTNCSTGYFAEHSDREQLDVLHLQRMAAAVVRIQWDALPTERDPKVDEDKWSLGGWATTPLYNGLENMSIIGLLDGASDGDVTPLMTALAELAYPEDPAIALQHMPSSALTLEILDTAYDYAYSDDPDMALWFILDSCYSHV
jgi:hypothetical protein